jgi:hypothetical protein
MSSITAREGAALDSAEFAKRFDCLLRSRVQEAKSHGYSGVEVLFIKDKNHDGPPGWLKCFLYSLFGGILSDEERWLVRAEEIVRAAGFSPKWKSVNGGMLVGENGFSLIAWWGTGNGEGKYIG